MHKHRVCAESEAAQDAREREEGTQARLAVAQAFREIRSSLLSEKREAVEQCIAERTGSLAARRTRENASPLRGNEVRKNTEELKRQRQAFEDQYLSWARDNRSQAEETRLRAKKSLLRLLRTKEKAGRMERSNDSLVAQQKRKVVLSNRAEVNAIYSRRFASKEEVSRMLGHGTDKEVFHGETGPKSAVHI